MKPTFRALNLEIRAKERLTGAVILVALVVLLVPELLSGPHHGGVESAAERAESALRSVTIQLGTEPARENAGTQARAQPLSVQTAKRPVSAAHVMTAMPAAPATPPAPPPPAAAASSGPQSVAADVPAASVHAAEQWSVQLGSFASRENAERLVRDLRRQGFAARVSSGEGRGRRWYRVRAGPAPDHLAAVALARRLKSAGHTGSVVPGS